jgi:hypothetical protein
MVKTYLAEGIASEIPDVRFNQQAGRESIQF